MRILLLIISFILSSISVLSEPLLHNAYNRESISLDGQWHYIIDPYETGYRNHRNWVAFDVKDFKKASANPYYADKKMDERWERVEYNFAKSPTLKVPGDWNSQEEKLLYYEGVVWYQRQFEFHLEADKLVYLYFGASNYETVVYVNGKRVGSHLGGYNPFNFEVSGSLLEGKNSIVVMVDNKREVNNVPNLATDWWNFGGITRSIKLVKVPHVFIQDYFIQLDPDNKNTISGFIQLNTPVISDIRLEIPELNISNSYTSNDSGKIAFSFRAKNINKWYPERPKLYDVSIQTDQDKLHDRIGFRTIETKGKNILLNGQSIFLRGISLHAQIPQGARTAYSLGDAKILLSWAKDLNCNFVRLAHYPHDENMVRLADETGLLLWEEIPVYWGISYANEEAYAQAKNQLKSLVNRDKNRASVIVWSLANETPVEEARNNFLKQLKSEVLKLDDTRFISAALDRHEEKDDFWVTIKDPFAEEVDVLCCNEYLGWYGSLPDRLAKMTWELPSDKPFFVSEYGAGALKGYRGDSLTMWTEDYQVYLYKEQIKMLKKVPTLRGMTPWILVDFRSPRRNLAEIQDGWNRKGLISDKGEKKAAFNILKAYYDEMEKAFPVKIEK